MRRGHRVGGEGDVCVCARDTNSRGCCVEHALLLFGGRSNAKLNAHGVAGCATAGGRGPASFFFRYLVIVILKGGGVGGVWGR